MPYTTKTPNMIFVVNSVMKSFHGNEKKKTYFGNSYVTVDVITLDVTWQLLFCYDLSFFSV